MSYNGSGTFVINTSGQPVVAATLIQASVFNALSADLASGLSTCILKDGTQTITANIPFNNSKITGLGAATTRTDAASLATIQDGTGVYVGTVGGTADAITLTPSPAITAYAAGQTFRFIASGANTGAVTVNVSGLGAKAITKNGTTALAASDIAAAAMVSLTYDGTRFILTATSTATLNGVTLNTATIAAPVLSGTITGTYTLGGTPTISDTITIGGSSDGTKKLAFEVDGLTASTTRTQYIVDEDASSGQSWEVKNLTLTATVAASALTVALKTKSGGDASATNPILFKFRNATAGTGDYTVVSLTAAHSLVVSSGSTLGTASGVAHRLYVGIANDAGTLRLFVYNPLVSATLNLLGLQDDLLYSSTAEGGAGAADTAQVLYSGTAFTSKAVRLLGYVESSQATAGTWATTPSKINILKPWDKRTGDVIQIQRAATGTMATGTTTTPADDTIPQNTEGTEFMTQAITPTSAINLLSIDTTAALHSSTGGTITIAALFQDSTANALVARATSVQGVSGTIQHGAAMQHVIQALGVSSTTIKFRAGASSASTITFNGDGGAQRFGGVNNSYLAITEIMV